MQTAALLFLLTLPLIRIASPDVTVWHIHPATLLLVGGAWVPSCSC